MNQRLTSPSGLFVASATGNPHHSAPRFDWMVIALSSWFVGGLFLDGWAHTHGKVDTSFFTPWHGVLYSGHLATLLYLGWQWSRQRTLPAGYGLSLAGALLFVVGGVGDFIWHELFGIERSIEALLSPTHLLLALGLALEPMARPADQPPGRYVKVPDAADGAWTQHSGVTTVNTRERSPYRLALGGDRPTPPRPSLAGAGPGAERLHIAASFRLDYRVPDAGVFTDEQLSAFGQVNGVYNAWPFWREYVYSTMARLGLPPMTLPVFRVEH